MRFSVQLPTDRVEAGAEFLAADSIAEMARCAEAAGFDACFVTDHPIPDDRWLAHGGHHSLDPFVALSLAAAATRRLRLHTHVLVLPYRNPFLTAKAVASLDVVSGGRAILGVAAGYLEGEFAALGADFAARNELSDEALRVIQRSWREEGLVLEGRSFAARGNSALPRPLQKPHPPIWVGGNSRRAIRRAVELGDGWAPFPAPPRLAGHLRTAALETPADLARRLAYAREQAEASGRTRPLDVCLVPFGFELGPGEPAEADALWQRFEELEALGVTWLAINVPCESRREYCERVERFGSELLTRR